MKNEWKCIYYQGSCIKEVDDSRRRLLFQIPERLPVARIWISMKSTKFEQVVGNGYYQKLFFRDDFLFYGYEIIDGYRHDFSISAPVLADYCKPMHNHIQESMNRRYEAERLNEKRQNDQKGRY